MIIDNTCEHYCGDEDCAKCGIYGIIVSGCAGCGIYESRRRDWRRCRDCSHYVKKELDNPIVPCYYACDSWECHFEPNNDKIKERADG